jgi:hypothetical protein
MDWATIAIYVGVFAVALAFFFGLKWAAKVFGTGNLEAARASLAALPGFEPSDILVYIGSAIAWDESTGRIAIWEKEGGARLVDPSGVGSWHSGTLLTVVLGRTTATPMVQLFSGADDASPFFKVGVLEQKVCPVWEKRLAAAFGADRNREVHVRVIGVN